MFHCCKSLISLNDISKWKFTQFESIGKYNWNELFYACISLVSLPNISKRNVQKLNI